MENENMGVPEVNTGEAANNTATQTKDVPAGEKRCPACAALLAEGQSFCPDCGASLKKTCPHCGIEIQDDAAFCPACGQRCDTAPTPNDSIQQFNQGVLDQGTTAAKKKKTWIVLGIVALVAIIAAYFGIQAARISAYKENAKQFCSDVLTAAANLEDIGNAIEDEWYDYIYDRWSYYDSVDEAVAAAMSYMSSEINTAERQKLDIQDLYDDLATPVGNSAEMHELNQAVRNLYQAYLEFYECVTDPSGNYRTFSDYFGECDDETVEAYRDLKDLCEDY